MSDKLYRRVETLSRSAGPAVTRFTEYLAGECYRQAERAALMSGFTTAEAKEIAATTVAGAIKSFGSAGKQAIYDRRFVTRT